MEISKEYVPQLAEQHSYVQFDKNTYVLCIDGITPIKLNVNQLTKSLLEQIDGNRNLEDITYAFNRANQVNFSVEDIISIFNKQLVGYGIFDTDNLDRIKAQDEYLKLRMTLLPAWVVKKITPFLTFLFSVKLFVVLFVASLVFLAANFAFNIDIQAIYHDSNPKLLGVLVSVVYLSLLLHEFGHAAACERFGANSGAIGFGFYVFTPVFYADVTDTWRLKRHERLIVDFGGIYMQLLMCVLLTIAFYLTREKALLYISFVIGLSVAANLNPLLRYDGYWALSDALNISNLKGKSMTALGKFFGMCIGINKNWDHSRRALFLTAYGLVSAGAFIAFAGYMLFFNHHSLLNFPLNLYSFVHGLLFDFKQIDFFWLKSNIAKLFIPFVFYYMLIKSIIEGVRNKYFATRAPAQPEAVALGA
ncbi:hypothetical protein [Hymenobacter cellulosilyticus]|uniref:Peptide zinc metalloprotease protein n=1 Tax=Hymenobacter cellulosilyticus TaxID=2932248 RepID=A0A8T9QBL7_9BACT|nr:hypothetical protein [Hymenobacter cellulosilyticus]UOQ72929.1 hypothetical protein MUN79_02790 [Hymenobacter cellulosilyticus]